MKKFLTTLLIIFVFVCPIGFVMAGKMIESSKEVADLAGLQTDKEFSPAISSVVGTIIGLLGVVFLLIIIYSGIVWALSGNNTEDLDKAKRMMSQAVIGLLITLSAYAFTSYVFKAIGTIAN